MHDEGTYFALGAEERTPAESVVALSSVNSAGLQSFLDRRGMEIGFVVDSKTGVSRMVIVDTLSGRKVLEIPAGSPLESAAMRLTTTREQYE
jgi:hypothetical protein